MESRPNMVGWMQFLFQGRGMFESTASAKHVLAELKASHLKAIRQKWPCKRRVAKSSVAPESRAKPLLAQPHKVDTTAYLRCLPDLGLPSSGASAGHSAHGLPCLQGSSALPCSAAGLVPICDAGAEMLLPNAEVAPATEALANLVRASAVDIPARRPVPTISSELAPHEPPQKKGSRWMVGLCFGRRKEKDAILMVGETASGRCARVLEEAQNEWQDALLSILDLDGWALKLLVIL